MKDTTVDQLRNSLTEHEYNYRRYNPGLLDSYVALPNQYVPLAVHLFSSILYTKKYGKGQLEYENKRIYNDRLITAETILKSIDPEKYQCDKDKLKHDSSNIRKKIDALHQNNVFYVWKYGRPIRYMVVLERHIGAWKFFNHSADVPPHSLLKILRCSRSMVHNMQKMGGQLKIRMNLCDIEDSFGNFISEMISKMNNEISKHLTEWRGGDLYEYICHLEDELNGLGSFDGLEVEDDFFIRLPPHVANKYSTLLRNNNYGRADIMEATTSSKVANDIIPKSDNGNLVSVTDVKTKPKSGKGESSNYQLKPKTQTFEEKDPFKNANEFISFYKACIRTKCPEARFYDPSSERVKATQILDSLQDYGHYNDKKFLRGWILFFADVYLRGNKIQSPEHTSLKNFSNSLDTYCKRRAV